jgi:hypothetical protein
VLVRYSRSGGIAGEMTALVVHRDRHAKLTARQGGRSWTVSHKRYRALRDALRAAHFETLKPSYADPNVADGITEATTFRGYTVAAGTGGKWPARLERALAKLRTLSMPSSA